MPWWTKVMYSWRRLFYPFDSSQQSQEKIFIPWCSVMTSFWTWPNNSSQISQEKFFLPRCIIIIIKLIPHTKVHIFERKYTRIKKLNYNGMPRNPDTSSRSWTNHASDNRTSYSLLWTISTPYTSWNTLSSSNLHQEKVAI